MLERAHVPNEVPRTQIYYVEAENDCNEVPILTESRASVPCELNFSSSQLEDEVKSEDSVSRTSQTTKKAALMTRAQALNDGLELKRRQSELQHNQKQLNLRDKISEVEVVDRVYQLFEESVGWSDDINPVRSLVKKPPSNPNVAKWSSCTLSECGV